MKKFFLMFICLSYLNAADIIPLTEEMEPWQIKDGKNLKGISVDMVQEIQKRIGNENKILLLPWNRAYNMTLKKESFALFLTTRSEEREKIFKWVGPLLPYDVTVYKSADNPKVYNSLEDAKKAESLAVTKNDIVEQFLSKEGFENLSVSFGKSAQYNIELLAQQKVELLPIGTDIGEYRIKRLGLKDKIVKTKIPAFLKKDMYIAFNIKTSDSIIKKWQDALDGMKKDGTYQSIIKKYR